MHPVCMRKFPNHSQLQFQVGYAYSGHPDLQANANLSLRHLSKLDMNKNVKISRYLVKGFICD